MWWIIGLTTLFTFSGIFVLALCKSAGDYDRSLEEAFERHMADECEKIRKLKGLIKFIVFNTISCYEIRVLVGKPARSCKDFIIQ